MTVKKIDFCVEISEILVQNHGRGQAFFLGICTKDFPYNFFIKGFLLKFGRKGFIRDFLYKIYNGFSLYFEIG